MSNITELSGYQCTISNKLQWIMRRQMELVYVGILFGTDIEGRRACSFALHCYVQYANGDKD